MSNAPKSAIEPQALVKRLSDALQQSDSAAAIAAITALGHAVYASQEYRDALIAVPVVLETVAALLQSDTETELLVAAAWFVRCLCSTFQENVRAALAQAHACERVSALLAHSDSRVRIEACLGLYMLCNGFRDNQMRALDAGAMAATLRLLADTDESVKHSAAKALAALASGHNTRGQDEFAAAAGSMRVLVMQLRNGSNVAFTKDVVWALGCLVAGQHGANQASFAAEQGMQSLVGVLTVATWPDLVFATLWAISLLCTHHPQNQLQFAAAGEGMQTLVRWLSTSDNLNIQQQAAFAIAQACANSCIATQNRFAEHKGAVSQLVMMVHSNAWLVRRNALLAIASACDGHSGNLSAFAEIAGGTAAIADKVSDTNEDVQVAAVGTLAVVLAHPLVKRHFMASENGLDLLANTLQTSSPDIVAGVSRAISQICAGNSKAEQHYQDVVGADVRISQLLRSWLKCEEQRSWTQRQVAAAIGSLCSNRHHSNQQQFIGDLEVVQALAAAMGNADHELQRNATWTLGVICDHAPAAAIAQLFTGVPQISHAVIGCLEKSALVETQLHALWVISITCKQGGSAVQAMFRVVPELADNFTRLLQTTEWQLLRNTLAAIAALSEGEQSGDMPLFSGCSDVVAGRVTELLEHHKPIIRAHAAWAIGCLAAEGVQECVAFFHEATLARLVDMLDDEVPLLRQRAAHAIGRLCSNSEQTAQLLIDAEPGLDRLFSTLQDQSVDVRRSATWALGVLCRRQYSAAQDRLASKPLVMKSIVDCLADRDSQVTQNAAWLVGCACDQHAGNQQLFGETEQGFAHLVTLLSARQRQIKHNAVWSIHHACNRNPSNCAKFLGCDNAWAQVQALLDDDDEDIRNLADALSTMLNPESSDDDGNDQNTEECNGALPAVARQTEEPTTD